MNLNTRIPEKKVIENFDKDEVKPKKIDPNETRKKLLKLKQQGFIIYNLIYNCKTN